MALALEWISVDSSKVYLAISRIDSIYPDTTSVDSLSVSADSPPRVNRYRARFYLY